MTYTAGSHQAAIKTLWLHFQGAVMSSIFMSSQCFHWSASNSNQAANEHVKKCCKVEDAFAVVGKKSFFSFTLLNLGFTPVWKNFVDV